MTSSRGQNVSVFHLHSNETWNPPITAFTDTGGSLRSLPRNNSLCIGKNTAPNEKTDQHLLKNFVKGTYANLPSKDGGFNNPCPNVLTPIDGNPIDRELSPVRWCDRKVDGVYLGKSGWVQVQQTTLNGHREIRAFPASSFKKHFSKLDSPNEERPLNLPLQSKKHLVRENHERPSKFVQEFESASPPSITPIISPPPAFKDDGSSIDFPRRSVKKTYFSEKPFVLKSGDVTSLGDSSYAAGVDRICSESLPFDSTTSSPSTLKHELLSHGALRSKSLEDYHFNGMYRDKRFTSSAAYASFGFRSLDNDSKDTVKVSESGSFYKNFETPTEKKNFVDCDEKKYLDGKKSCDGGFLARENSSEEGSDEFNMNFKKTFRQRNSQRNGRRNSSNCKTRSSSLESSSSSRSSSSGSSFSGENSNALRSSRRSSKEKESFEIENCSKTNGKNFYVKRSRSLQLSEQRSPSEPTMNHFVSGKSWNAMLPESSPLHISTQNEEDVSKFPQHFSRVLITVNGDSIPFSTLGNQSLKSLNKIAKSEEEQRKLIKEAEKEARIVSEFLNGARSRAAARNLLLHRYFGKKEGGDRVETVNDDPAETECESLFSENDRRYQNKGMPFDVNRGRGNFFKKNKPDSLNSVTWHPATVYTKSFAYGTLNHNRNAISSETYFEDQRCHEWVENKRSGGCSLNLAGECGSDRQKSKNANRLPNQRYPETTEKPLFFLSNQKESTKNFIRRDVEKLDSENERANVKSSLKRSKRAVLANKVMETDEQNLSKSSSASSSSNTNTCTIDSSSKLKTNLKATAAFNFFEENFKTSVDLCDYSPLHALEEDDGSAPPVVDQRSLSLPRSFLSECLNRRDLQIFRCQFINEDESEMTGDIHRSRTAPTTPTRDSKFGKSSESLSQIQCNDPSCTSLPEDPLFLRPRRISQRLASEKTKSSEVCGSESPIYGNPLSVPENSSKAAFKKFRKKFPLKYLKATGYFKDPSVDVKQEADSRIENSNEMCSAACRINHLPRERSAQVSEITRSDPSGFRFSERQRLDKKGFKNEKYDSHDSGIQMGNRGYLDSSESQDTDFQDDFDSPLLIRRREIFGSGGLRKTQLEIANRVFPRHSKKDVQWSIRAKKHKCRNGVRRTNSDLGGRKLSSLDDKNCRRLVSCASPARSQHPKTGSSESEDATVVGMFAKSQLRRSLSQPAGLNEFLPISRKSSMSKRLTLSENEGGSREKNSEDECLSDSESSLTSLRVTQKSIGLTSMEKAAVLAEAVWDHVAMESGELPFRAGDVIEVLDTRNWDWWWGATAHEKGYFPSAFVRLRVNQEDTVEDCLDAMAKGKCASDRLRRGKGISLLSNDEVRSSVVSELLNTERDFVKILRDVKVGYAEQCKRRTDMFTSEQIVSIFSNLEDVLDFQEKFLKDLEAEVDQEFPYKSCIGQVFLTHGSGFHVYSEYCNSHPIAIATLQDLYRKNSYCKFFETCRLKQSLMEIPLDGYLLTPVQRICKYPLQLAELLKYTKPDHSDFKKLEQALETMRRVATLINERKRKMESLEKLAGWQQRVEGWEGGDLIELSSRLIHQGDVVRITSGMWTSNITLFLFDHQIIYCKKDLLKRNVYIYKGRIFLDDSFVVNVPDGRNQQLGVTVRYGLKICSSSNDKWLLFCCKSNEDKIKWLEALAEEKKFVAQDQEVDLDLPLKAKELAKMTAMTKKCIPNKPRCKTKISSYREEMPFKNCPQSTSKSKTNRRVGTWFTFGGVMKSSKTSPKHRTSLHRIS